MGRHARWPPRQQRGSKWYYKFRGPERDPSEGGNIRGLPGAASTRKKRHGKNRFGNISVANGQLSCSLGSQGSPIKNAAAFPTATETAPGEVSEGHFRW
jgi:hypothetical protein